MSFENVVCKVCDNWWSLENGFDMLFKCKGCDAHFHLKCLGMNTLPDEWYCPRCIKVKNVAQNTKNGTHVSIQTGKRSGKAKETEKRKEVQKDKESNKTTFTLDQTELQVRNDPLTKARRLKQMRRELGLPSHVTTYR